MKHPQTVSASTALNPAKHGYPRAPHPSREHEHCLGGGSGRSAAAYFGGRKQRTRLQDCAAHGGPSATLNCGYGRGYSVIETIEAVRRASGRNFAVQYAARRPGDIMTMIADTARIRATLDWTPQYDNLDTIARHALAWEEKLLSERQGDGRQAASA